MIVQKLMDSLMPDHREMIARASTKITDEDIAEINETIWDNERRFYGSLIFFTRSGTHRFAIKRQNDKIYAEGQKNPGNGWLFGAFAVISISVSSAFLIRSDDFSQTIVGVAGILMPVAALIFVNFLSTLYFKLSVHKAKSHLAAYL